MPLQVGCQCLKVAVRFLPRSARVLLDRLIVAGKRKILGLDYGYCDDKIHIGRLCRAMEANGNIKKTITYEQVKVA